MDALGSLRVYLEKPPRRKDKAPTGFDKELKATSHAATYRAATSEAASPNVSVTLLEAGFQAWYAYFVADSDTRSIVNELSPLELHNMAEELCKVVLHEDIKELFQHLFDIADRGDSRYRCLETSGCRVLPNFGSRKRRRTIPTHSPDVIAGPTPIGVSLALPAPVTPHPVRQIPFINSIQAVESVDHESLMVDQGERLPFAMHLSSIFPPIMLSSIVKRGDKAEVQVVQLESSEQSRLRLSICPQRIPYLAKEIFDVDADIEGLLLHLRLENGANAKILELDGAKHRSLEKCFGIQIAAAIRSTRTFITEVNHGKLVTKCVALEVNPCSLNLMLDPDSLSVIVAKMWPAEH